ncbi:hypothetical protein AVEN_133369-1 [Araneus ventricosus]|uniref:Uncharacterized protein n=1 Tax=Araneus ventricosus TaxID=182803 RepID=A0A4Y2K9M9_ARAVE|nr:hypothetical protein AVEN_133369-1 [Araneus ventricosus]
MIYLSCKLRKNSRPSVKVSSSGSEGHSYSKPDSTEDLPYMSLLRVKSYVGTKHSPAGVVLKFGEGVPAQVSSSSSDSDSKLQGPSQNSPRIASKRVADITKLRKNTIHFRLRKPLFILN